MEITRRHLTMAGALTLGGVGLLRSASVVAASADEAAGGPGHRGDEKGGSCAG
jgi:hypothetical protein